MNRKHRVECFVRMFPDGSSETFAKVLTHNGKVAAECRSLRMARKVAQALDDLDAKRRRYPIKEALK